MKKVFATVLVALVALISSFEAKAVALLGLRWFFTDNLALSFELQHSAGYGPLANIGLAFKF